VARLFQVASKVQPDCAKGKPMPKLAFWNLTLFIAVASPLCADVDPLTFTKLTGLTGGSPAGTAVYRADLSGLSLAQIQSLTIQDNSAGLGGAAGQFSGFDLDAIKLSTTLCADATCAAGLAGLSVFDFTSDTFFTPGVQRVPTDPKLFGTGPAGNTVDNSVATLGSFDANSTTTIPGAAGFISMGDGGTLSFNLTSPVSTAGLFVYIGEVGDNGEVAAGSITVSDRRIVTPEPGSILLLGTVAGALLYGLRRRFC
jgi:hypothetical protein